MKKRLTSVVLAVVMVLSLCVPAFAEDTLPEVTGTYSAGVVRIPYEQNAVLEQNADSLYIYVSNVYGDYPSRFNYKNDGEAANVLTGRLTPQERHYKLRITNGQKDIATGWVIFEHSITYNVSPTGGGTVTGDPTATEGETVKFTVSPNRGYKLDTLTVMAGTTSITPEKTNPDNPNEYEFTMLTPASDVEVTANFVSTAVPTHTINYPTTDNGKVNGPASAAEGADVTLTVVPATGCELGELTVTDASGKVELTKVNDTTYTFKMPTSDVTVAATFTKIPYNIKTNVTNGTVTAQVGGETVTTATMGDKVALTATPNPGYTLDGELTVTDASGNVPLGADNTFTMPASDVTVTANFKVIPPNEYRITIENPTTGGTVIPNVTSATAGTTVTLTGSPNPGYVLDVVTVTGSSGTVTVNGTGNTRTFTMPNSAVTVTATFRKVSYDIKLVDNGFGTVTANRTTATIGDTVTLTLAAETGCELDNLVVTDASGGSVQVTGTGNTRTFTMPASNVTVKAAFKQTVYSVSVRHSKVTTDKTDAVYGESVTLTVHPGANEKVEPVVTAEKGGSVAWTKTGDNTYVFIMPDSNVEVSANVTTVTYNITVNDEAKVTASPAGPVEAGTRVTLTVRPGTGEELDTLTVTTTPGGTPVTVTRTGNTGTFTMPSSDVIVVATFKAIKPNEYTVTITDSKVSASPSGTVKADDTVTLTVKPGNGELLDTLTVTDANGNPVELTKVNDTTYTFKMPASNVTVATTWKYAVRHQSSTGGTVTSDVASAAKDATVTLTVTPSSNYELASLTVTNARGEALSLTQVNTTTYTFVMPESPVTVTPTWRYNGGGGGGVIGVPSYTINPPAEVENGDVSISHSRANQGTVVTITVFPDEGYQLGTLTVTDASGKEITLTNAGDGKYTFTMPAGQVNVNATFKPVSSVADCPKDDTCPITPFKDTRPTAWYHDGIHYCIEHGLMNGVSSDAFAPNASTDRAMIAMILWRQDGSPKTAYTAQFTDVAEGKWYAEPIAWAAANGVVTGYGNGTFGPRNPITREQMAVMLYRYAQLKGYDTSVQGDLNTYSDAGRVSSWAVDAMRWANANGLIVGNNNGLLNPRGNATRAQVATILMRFCESIAK